MYTSIGCRYLAGHWDLNAHNLAITHTYPCLSDTKDAAEAHACETEIYNAIYGKHLTVVGWYKTTPGYHKALPSIRDAEAQLDNQVWMISISPILLTFRITGLLYNMLK